MSKRSLKPPAAWTVLALVLGVVLGLFIGRPRRPSTAASSEAEPAPVSPSMEFADKKERSEFNGQGAVPVVRLPAGRRRLPWQAERVAWAAVWTVSISVIVVSVLNSLSQPSPQQTVAGLQSSPHRPLQAAAAGFSAELVDTRPQALAASAKYALSLWPQPAGGDKGESAMLFIEDAVPGATYTFAIGHACVDGSRASSDLPRNDDEGGLSPPDGDGPQGELPDATLAAGGIARAAPESDLSFRLWGGSFAAPAVTRPSASGCRADESEKGGGAYTIVLTARASAVYLLWNVDSASQPD